MFLKSDMQLHVNKKSIKDNTIKYSSKKQYINDMYNLIHFMPSTYTSNKCTVHQTCLQQMIHSVYMSKYLIELKNGELKSHDMTNPQIVLWLNQSDCSNPQLLNCHHCQSPK